MTVEEPTPLPSFTESMSGGLFREPYSRQEHGGHKHASLGRPARAAVFLIGLMGVVALFWEGRLNSKFQALSVEANDIREKVAALGESHIAFSWQDAAWHNSPPFSALHRVTGQGGEDSLCAGSCRGRKRRTGEKAKQCALGTLWPFPCSFTCVFSPFEQVSARGEVNGMKVGLVM